ncbi:hypothetical protein [Cryobacterium sp. Y57]|uniref:hypothetical protein n=1 Tax=Cryobacterium sp. Y57 TaxID=2048287 RepID=UPI000CE56816|nr:hypothetical protein [Cryobacterium sp. Y57]
MTRPPAPYPPEPTHGSRILESDRRRRIARRNHLHELEVWSLVFLIAALGWAGTVGVIALIVWSNS